MTNFFYQILKFVEQIVFWISTAINFIISFFHSVISLVGGFITAISDLNSFFTALLLSALAFFIYKFIRG